MSEYVFIYLFSSDLFEKMVPMAVQQSMGIYSQRKAETVNRLVGMMREATNLCNGWVKVASTCAEHNSPLMFVTMLKMYAIMEQRVLLKAFFVFLVQ